MPFLRAGRSSRVEPGTEVLPAVPRWEPALPEQPTGSGEQLSFGLGVSGRAAWSNKPSHSASYWENPSTETRAWPPLGWSAAELWPEIWLGGEEPWAVLWVWPLDGRESHPVESRAPVCALQMWLQGQVPGSLWTGLHSSGRDLWSWLDGTRFNQALKR